MFEILKLFVEQVFKLLDVRYLVSSRDKSKLSEIGMDLFSLYNSLNAIYVHGTAIISCIKEIEKTYEERKKRDKQVKGRIGTLSLYDLLQNQKVNIRNFAREFKRLYTYMGIIDPESSRNIQIFIADKTTVIDYLIDFMAVSIGTSGRNSSLLFSPTTETVLADYITGYISRRRGQSPSSITYTFLLDFDDYGNLKSDKTPLAAIAREEAISNFRGVTEKEVLILKRYLLERRPEERLDYLKKMLDELYKNLVLHFKIEDVLLKVGDARIKDLEPFPAIYFWERRPGDT